jgi:hypothetical protein
MEDITVTSIHNNASVGCGDANTGSEKYGTVADQRDMYRSKYCLI